MTGGISLLNQLAVQFIGHTCDAASGGGDCQTGLPGAAASGHQLHLLLQIALGIFAVIAVLMIIIAAMNILYAEGDPQKISKSRSTIIYAMVGLVVALSAEIIVTFVVGNFF